MTTSQGQSKATSTMREERQLWNVARKGPKSTVYDSRWQDHNALRSEILSTKAVASRGDEAVYLLETLGELVKIYEQRVGKYGIVTRNTLSRHQRSKYEWSRLMGPCNMIVGWVRRQKHHYDRLSASCRLFVIVTIGRF